jgi:hypothetical protein
MIPFVCPKCKTASTVGDQFAGSGVVCPSCGTSLHLPPPPPPSAAVQAPPARRSRRGETEEEPVERPDEDESTLRAELPPDYPPDARDLGPPRFRVERQVLHDKAFHPVFAAALSAIPGVICIGAGPLLPRLIGLVWTAALLAFSWWFILWQLRKTRIQAVVHTGGFVLFDGRRFIPWRWEDTASVNLQDIDQRSFVYFIEVSRLLTKFYRLRHHNGVEYSFWSTQGPRAAQFGRLLENETFAWMTPAAVADLQAGRAVDFTPFQMWPDGLVYCGRFTPWSEVGRPDFKNGRLHLGGVGPGRGEAVVLLKKIDNSHVFLALLIQKLGLRRED